MRTTHGDGTDDMPTTGVLGPHDDSGPPARSRARTALDTCDAPELHDLRTFVEKMVELDPAERWTYDASTGLHQSEPVQTQKTKKEQRPIVLYHATEHHPAQTQLITEDVVIGHWTTTKYSGAIPRPRKRALQDRIVKLEEAVKFARERANARDAVEVNVGRRILDFVFEGTQAEGTVT